jgi:hypothetical protein
MPLAYIVLVTPKMAETWLQQNVIDGRANRRFRKSHAHTIAEEMRRGEWKLTHQGIAFGSSGRLLDGQHRLSAIVESGTSQRLLVFLDAPEEAYDNHDRGAMRGLADVLSKDQKLVTLGSTMVRLCTRGAFNAQRKPIPSEVEKVLSVFMPSVEAMREVTTVDRVGRTLAAIRVAWLLHYHSASEADKKVLRAQWKAFAEYDTKRMDESTVAGDKRLENFRAVRGGAMEIETACIGWLMFDPARRDMERVVIRSTSTAMDELRAAASAIMPELVPLVELPKAAAVPTPTKSKPRGWADPEIGPILRQRAAAAKAAKANGAAHI